MRSGRRALPRARLGGTFLPVFGTLRERAAPSARPLDPGPARARFLRRSLPPFEVRLRVVGEVPCPGASLVVFSAILKPKAKKISAFLFTRFNFAFPRSPLPCASYFMPLTHLLHCVAARFLVLLSD